MNKTILQFLSYEPKVYSALDRFTIEVDRQLRREGDRSVMVYNNNIASVPQLGQALAANGIEVALIQDGSPSARLRQVFDLFRKYRPDLVHTHFDDGLKVMVAVCALYFRTPLIVNNHCELSKYPSLGAYRRERGNVRALLFGTYLRFLLFASEKYLSVSEKVAQQFTRFAGKSDKSQPQYFGITGPDSEGDVAAIREKLGLPTGTFLIANVSAIEPIKGFEVIVEAVRLLRDQYGHLDFMFCHIGGLRSGAAGSAYFDDIKRSIEEHGLTAHFRWLGIRGDVIDILQGFDAYIQPSRMEALGASVMEACACGLPCVVTNVGGLPEIITEGQNGYLIEKDDAAALADRLHRLMQDEGLRRRLGEGGRKVHAERFDIVKLAAKTRKIYERVY